MKPTVELRVENNQTYIDFRKNLFPNLYIIFIFQKI